MRRAGSRRVAICMLGIAFLAVGCSKEADKSPAGVKQMEIDLPLRISVTGAVKFQFEDDSVRVRRLRLDDERLPEARYLGFEPKEPLAVGGGAAGSAAKILPSLNVFGFAGKGTYDIPVSPGAEGPDPGQIATGNGLSTARLEYKAGDKYHMFAFVAKPCSAEIADSEGARGTLRCAMTDGKERISVTMSWG